uniref:Uncharacterized protein n=1 Tax=Utricularia reniformis TaxID=192314 RepID=A0A1Y0B128_9LAMI|nr:hypothetical protein AEK19_MT0943 [Utricularia reniformis]ART31166.1 hypothetical protein AEK19_MT0943 [Utricularia reniformis]
MLVSSGYELAVFFKKTNKTHSLLWINSLLISFLGWLPVAILVAVRAGLMIHKINSINIETQI